MHRSSHAARGASQRHLSERRPCPIWVCGMPTSMEASLLAGRPSRPLPRSTPSLPSHTPSLPPPPSRFRHDPPSAMIRLPARSRSRRRARHGKPVLTSRVAVSTSSPHSRDASKRPRSLCHISVASPSAPRARAAVTRVECREEIVFRAEAETTTRARPAAAVPGEGEGEGEGAAARARVGARVAVRIRVGKGLGGMRTGCGCAIARRRRAVAAKRPRGRRAPSAPRGSASGPG
jgi:hypothetical protein